MYRFWLNFLKYGHRLGNRQQYNLLLFYGKRCRPLQPSLKNQFKPKFNILMISTFNWIVSCNRRFLRPRICSLCTEFLTGSLDPHLYRGDKRPPARNYYRYILYHRRTTISRIHYSSTDSFLQICMSKIKTDSQ